MRYAILSDVHGKTAKLRAVLADAEAQRVDSIVNLGDVGSDECFDLLRAAGAVSVFGNYDVSTWPRLSEANRRYVLGLAPMLSGPTFLAVHAVPFWPDGLANVADFAAYMQRTGRKWRALFPYLRGEGDHLWRAVAKLEAAGRDVLFHGHTHRQAVWRVGADGRLARVRRPVFTLSDGARYVVGVGSAGQPEDGPPPRYVVYDEGARRIEMRRVENGVFA